MNGRLYGSEGRELAQKALELMERYNVPPTPQNYAVWSSFASDHNPELCEAIQTLLNEGVGFDRAVCDDLYERFFQLGRVQDVVLSSSGEMTAELKAVHQTLKAAEIHAATYGKALEGASVEMAKPIDQATLSRMVETLVDATAKMQTRSRDLERRLHATSREVTQLRTNLERVREEAMTDALTGVANRKRFDESLRKARRAAENDGEPFSLILCDIDFFKRFNDTWGHQTGDQIIRFVAGCMTRHAADHHTVARYGGEEFGIVLPKTHMSDAIQIAEMVRKTVESKKLLRKSTNEDLGNITISLGVAEYAPGESIECLIERSDANLYKSKQDGRNRVTADPDISTVRSAA